MGAIDTISSAERRLGPSHKLYAPVSSVPVWKVLWRRYCQWQSMRRSQVALRYLSKEQLSDIGISREQALQEANNRGRPWNRICL